MKLKVVLTAILALIAIGLFYYAIYMAIVYSLDAEPASMPALLNWVIVVIGGALATILGSVLGIKVIQGGGIREAFQEISTDPSKGIRNICAVLYLIALIVALICWGKLDWIDDPKQIADSIPMLSKTLIGVVVGALTVIAN